MNRSKNTQGNELLRQARIGRNWRQHELAEQLGTTTVTVKRWERGYQQPSTYFQVKLCALFGKSARELGLDEGDSSVPITEENVSETEQASLAPTEPAAFWMVPYRRNPHFTGRDDLLEQLAQELSSEKSGDAKATRQAILSQPRAIKGLGGIGKTQIAVEYAYRAREQGHYTHIFWINAASEEALLASFQMLAEQLPNCAARDEQDQRKLIAAVLRWLEQCQERWLLIVDNADDLSIVQPCLPQQGQGSILLTTRAHAVGALAHAIEVDTMGLVEGTQFLLHRSQRLHVTDEEHNKASNIVIALDGFPLALDQAGAYIEETGCNFGDYLGLYEQHRATLLARRGRQATHYPDSVATTWDLSFQKIEQAYPAAADLLRLCASLSPDHIPEELLTEGVAQWPPLLQQAVADQFTFNELIEALLAFSLVKRLAEERLLSIHRLVQAVQMDRMEPEEQRSWAERVVRAVHTLFPADPRNEIDTWPLCLRYLEQVQACEWLIRQHSLQVLEAAELLDRVGIYLWKHASYSIAEPLFQRALAIAEQQGRAGHLQVASSLNNLGILYYEQGKYELAEPLYQRALHIREQDLGPDHPLVARSLNNLGIFYSQQGKYEQAEPLLQRALHIREQALGPEHPQVAYPLTNLGDLYCEQGKYEQAEPLLQRALHIWEQALGPDHPQLAFPLTDLGILYRLQGRYELAEPLLRRSLRIREQTLGPQHPLLVEPLNALANLSREQSQYEQADALYQRALSLLQQSRGSQHADVGEILYDLAQLRQMQQHDAEALSLYQQALALQEQARGANHPKTCETRKRLSTILQTLGRTEVAVLEAPSGPTQAGE
ncbi:MAG TPA: FxSxx-COOH system tetratricopeptide repeat protein [Ktedonobacteraceae bacterium]|nr:FxSxx-COOH system tetratricopeptide repeat protein [Ktedonobacteraceae bacterium]